MRALLVLVGMATFLWQLTVDDVYALVPSIGATGLAGMSLLTVGAVVGMWQAR